MTVVSKAKKSNRERGMLAAYLITTLCSDYGMVLLTLGPLFASQLNLSGIIGRHIQRHISVMVLNAVRLTLDIFYPKYLVS